MDNGTEDLALAPATPMRLIEMAIAKGADFSTIELLVAQQEKEKMLSRNAEMAFNIAMNRAQKAMGRVAVDLDNPQTRSKYASYAALDRAIRPIYTEHGFSLSFDTGESPHPDIVRSICYVSHESGFTRTHHVDMPADGKGLKGGDAMTKTHATGAAMTYGRRYLVNYIFNVAIGEDDVDGNTNGELAEAIAKIESIETIDELQRYFLTVVDVYKKATNNAACKALIEAKDRRKTQLQPKPYTRFEDGTVTCVVLDVMAKSKVKTGGKTANAYVTVKTNGPQGADMIFCWHEHLFPALATAKKNDRATFIVEKHGEYLNLKDVLSIGAQKFEGGKEVR